MYSRPTCRGSYALGTACGRCEKCEAERPKLGGPPRLHRSPPALGPQPGWWAPSPRAYAGGFIGWPDVFFYAWSDEAGRPFLTALPPPRVPPEVYTRILAELAKKGGEVMQKKPVGEPTWPYHVVVAEGKLAEYETLVRTGALYRPDHRPDWEAILKSQETPSAGPYSLLLLKRQPDGAPYPTVAGDGWQLTHNEQAQGARRVLLPAHLQHADPATLLQLWYEGKLDCSGDTAVEKGAALPPVSAGATDTPTAFSEDGYEGG